MKARLIASGIRPINNVVDITNFVLMEMGQPLHAFDADKLGNTIVVRQAYDNEKLKTLDDQERELNSEDIVITDGKNAVCDAGVMGGLSTEVDDNTVNIVLEAAYCDPLSIRRTSTKIGLKSESSTRFERKIDYDRVERALDYAAQLMQELAGAEIYDGVARDVKVDIEPKYVSITTEKINKVLGTSLEDSYINDLFNRLAYDFTKKDNTYTIKLPSRRMDLESSVQDIIEDVARMYGYNNIPTTIAATRDKGALTYAQKRARLIRQILSSLGLNEIVSYSLISEAELGYYLEHVEEPIRLLMPMTEDKAIMRESVLNGVVDAIAYNKARKNENLAFFEIANVHTATTEDLHLGIALNGLFESHLWKGQKQVAEFYLLKGIVDDLFEKFNFHVTYEPYSGI
jgi:phenylalanyl-tRNA synthetase beta chain